MSLATYIAGRYLRSRRQSRFLNRATVTAVVGIVLGVMVLDLTLAIMNGFRADLHRTFVDNMPMITVGSRAPEGFIDLGRTLDTIGGIDGVTGVSPFIRQEVVASRRNIFGKTHHEAIVVWGIDPVLHDSVVPLTPNYIPGTVVRDALLDETGETPGIVLGVELANSLRASLRDTVIITAPAGDLDLNNLQSESRSFIVVGWVRSGMYEFDSRFAYVNLPVARDFFGYAEDGAAAIGIRIDEPMDAPQQGKRILARLDSRDLYANDWIRLNESLFKWIYLEKIVMFLLLGLVIIVAAFNIIGILTMMVGERGREIGILTSMGARKGQIMGIFVLNGLWPGFVGTMLGSLLAWLGGLGLRNLDFELPGDVYLVDTIPVLMQVGDFAMVGAVAMVITLLSTLAPSYEAASLKPIEIIRYT